MIVLWNRIRSAGRRIEDREWLLLLLEALSVIIGVFIAFQLQQWAEDKRQSQAHDRLMVRLLEEARQDLEYFRDVHESRQSRLERGSEIVLALNNGQCPSEEDIADLWAMDIYPTISAPQTVYQEMVAGAGLSSIDDLAVREAIIQYRRRVEFISGQNEFFRPDQSISDLEIEGLNYFYDPDRGRLSRIAAEPEKLCANREFSRHVNKSVRNQHRMQQYRFLAVRAAAHMCFEIARVTDEECFAGSLEPLSEDQRQRLIEIDARLHDGDVSFHASH